MELHKYQIEAKEFIKNKQRCALYLGMGLGKTVITLTAIAELIQLGKISKILIIAPLRVAHSVWHKEIEKWDHLKHLKYSICIGNVKQRLKALNTEADIYITNRENIEWLMTAKFNHFNMIVLDESSSFKNPSSKRFKALKKFKYEYIVELTGTPSPNNLLDIWSQFYLIDHGQRLEANMHLYKRKHFDSDYMGFKFTPRNPQNIYNAIQDITLTLRTQDYLDLPQKIEVNTYVNLDCMNEYKELMRNYILEIGDKEITSVNAGVLTNKLLQFCNGAIYDEHGATIELHNAKLNAIEELVNDNSNENILVAYNYKSDLRRLKERFNYAIELDKEGKNIEEWNKGNIKLLLCHPASAGKGINLQHGGNIIIWYGLTWNLEDYLQFNARLYRQGQQKPVIINHIIAKNCIDEEVMEALTYKNQNQNAMFDKLIKFYRDEILH